MSFLKKVGAEKVKFKYTITIHDLSGFEAAWKILKIDATNKTNKFAVSIKMYSFHRLLGIVVARIKTRLIHKLVKMANLLLGTNLIPLRQQCIGTRRHG
jgi:hypothetical protein